jgi:hypothetical protein
VFSPRVPSTCQMVPLFDERTSREFPSAPFQTFAQRLSYIHCENECPGNQALPSERRRGKPSRLGGMRAGRREIPVPVETTR